MRRFHSPQAWRDWVEDRALGMLRRLRQRGLWDGSPPVPVDHVLEQLLRLRILYEVIDEPPGHQILGCLRPADRLVILNERHLELFQQVPGLEAYTKGHEAGHADCYALAAMATEQAALARIGPGAARHAAVRSRRS